MSVVEEAGQAGWARRSRELCKKSAFLNQELLKGLCSKACLTGRCAIMSALLEAHCCDCYVGRDESGHMAAKGGLGTRREMAGTEMYLERETLALIEETVMERRGSFLTPS